MWLVSHGSRHSPGISCDAKPTIRRSKEYYISVKSRHL
ncbi:hypothetical protein RvY_08056 [Ramazzottius varieornatus]|uniref:Uncharacterized protein n=1 Tax=Ramazzottius varieornatus TaxID=947166 RepID=A0A1D1V4E3_RAMVA|nr:hypothetical protein RvY_08056 [Ramazzottius varieornatus]